MTELFSSVFGGHHVSANVVRVLPGETQAVSAGADGTVRIWDLFTGQMIGPPLKQHDAPIIEFDLLGGGKAASLSNDGCLALWDLAEHQPDGRPIQLTRECISWASILSNSRACMVARESTHAWLIDLQQRSLVSGPIRMTPPKPSLLQRISADQQEYEATAAIDDRRVLVTSWNRLGTYMRARLAIWDLSRNQITRRNLGSEEHKDFSRGKVGLVVPFNLGTRAIVGTEFGVLQLWDLDQLRCIGRMQTASYKITAITVFEGGHYAISGCDDGSLYLWDLTTCEQLGDRMIVSDGVRAIRSIALLSEGRCALLASSDGTLKIWDLSKLLSRPRSASASKPRGSS